MILRFHLSPNGFHVMLKGLVEPKMKILRLVTQPHDVQNSQTKNDLDTRHNFFLVGAEHYSLQDTIVIYVREDSKIK